MRAHRVYARGLAALPLFWALHKLAIVPPQVWWHVVAAVRQRALLRNGTCTYGAFIATKPESGRWP